MRPARMMILLAFLLLPGAILAPLWPLAGLGAGEDDILYYYPSRVQFGEMVAAGQPPWLNPWTGLGRPFAADPQSAVWYPFTWLFAVLPPAIAYSASLWLHFSLALWGMYRLLRSLPGRGPPDVPAESALEPGRAAPDPGQREEHLSRSAALFGALAFAFCGFMLAHRVHFAMHHAAAWVPWIVWRMQRYAYVGGTRRLAWAASVAAAQCFTGHVQIAALTAIGSLVLLLVDRRGPAFRRRAALVAGRWMLVWIFTAGLFAIQWLPTLSFLQQTTRTDRSYWQFVENSWNPASAVGWLLPMLFGQRTPNFFDRSYWGPSHQVEQFAYAGILPLLLGALALRAGWRADPRRRPWVLLGLFTLLLALGKYGPVCPILHLIPGSSLFRVPARAMLLFNLVVAVLAATMVHDLAGGLTPLRARLRAAVIRWTRRPIVVSLALVIVPAAAIVLALPLLDDATRRNALSALRPDNPALYIPLLLLMTTFAVLGHVARRWRQPKLIWLLPCVLAADLGVIGWTIDIPRDAGSVADVVEAAPVVSPETNATKRSDNWIRHVRGMPYRLWVVTAHTSAPGEYRNPLAKRSANTNVLVHVPSLTDYGPLQPVCLQERFMFAPWGESARAAALLADATWMRAYNVGWILLCEPEWAAPAGCDLVETTPDGMRLYFNPSAAGPALFADPTRLGAIRHVAHSPAAWTTHVDTSPATRGSPDQTARLIVSGLALPGWAATVDGQELKIEAYDNVLLSVQVPRGKPLTIAWHYFPPGLVTGAAVSALALCVLAFAGFPGLKRARRGRAR